MEHGLRRNLHASELIRSAALDYPSGARIDPHVHLTHQLVYAARGVMRVCAAAGTWVVPPTRALWVPAGVEHEIRTVGAVQMRTLYIDASNDRMPLRSTCVVAVTPLMRELILRLVELQISGEFSEQEQCIASLIRSDLALLRTQPLHVPLPNGGRLREICEAVSGDPGCMWGTRRWGERFGLSAKTIERDFRRTLGMSFGEWRRQVRLLAALERLASGESATSVALALGYGSPSAFTAMFRRALGNVPSSYFR